MTTNEEKAKAILAEIHKTVIPVADGPLKPDMSDKDKIIQALLRMNPEKIEDAVVEGIGWAGLIELLQLLGELIAEGLEPGFGTVAAVIRIGQAVYEIFEMGKTAHEIIEIINNLNDAVDLAKKAQNTDDLQKAADQFGKCLSSTIVVAISVLLGKYKDSLKESAGTKVAVVVHISGDGATVTQKALTDQEYVALTSPNGSSTANA